MLPPVFSFRVADAHCHVVDGNHWNEILGQLDDDRDRIIVMSTGFENIRQLSQEELPRSVIPAFGYHPWMAGSVYFEHQQKQQQLDKTAHYQEVLNPSPTDEEIADFAEPRHFDDYLSLMRKYLIQTPRAIVGELGLDKPFRLALGGEKLSRFRVDMDHQRKVLCAQLAIAGEFCRPISIHSVQCHGHVFSDVTRCCKGIPAVCLHSYSGSVDQLRQWMSWSRSSHVEVYMSVSAVLSLKNKKIKEYLEILPDSCILTESDLSNCSFEKLKADNDLVIEFLAQVKGRSNDQIREQISANFLRFIATNA